MKSSVKKGSPTPKGRKFRFWQGCKQLVFRGGGQKHVLINCVRWFGFVNFCESVQCNLTHRCMLVCKQGLQSRKLLGGVGFFVRLRMSICIIFYITLLRWEFLIKCYNFFWNFCWNRFLAVHHDVHWFYKPNGSFGKVETRSRKFLKGRSWSRIVYSRLRNPVVNYTWTAKVTLLYTKSIFSSCYFHACNESEREWRSGVRVFAFLAELHRICRRARGDEYEWCLLLTFF